MLKHQGDHGTVITGQIYMKRRKNKIRKIRKKERKIRIIIKGTNNNRRNNNMKRRRRRKRGRRGRRRNGERGESRLGEEMLIKVLWLCPISGLTEFFPPDPTQKCAKLL